MLSLHDSWVAAAEEGKLAGVALIDMSAAFDVVDTEILLDKCKLFNFDQQTLLWLSSYLTTRSQCTYISGSTSSILPFEAGVPQGSILGPALYTLYTCDFPEVVHQDDCPHSNRSKEPGEPIYRTMCTECGGLVCYADDSTYTVTEKRADELSTKLSSKFQEMATYLRDNRLCINTDKTHMLVMCTQQKRNRNPNIQDVRLDTGAELISPTQTEWLLGVPVHQDLNFGEMLISGKDS